MYSVSNYNQLDVNKSLTVDAADDECLSARNLGMTYTCRYFSRATGATVSPPTVSGFTPSNSSSSSAGRTYMRCHYENGQPAQSLSNYTLTPELSTLNTGVNSRKVFGDDERYPSYSPENNGIVYISMDGFYMASGFIVGDHQIATAASCVYDRTKSEWKKPTIYAYDNNGVMSKQLSPVEIHVPNRYISSGAVVYDYALITVEDDLSDYVHFSLGNSYNVTESDFKNIPLYVTGCPDDYPSSAGTNTFNRLYSAEGNICSSVNVSVLHHNIDTTLGQNGAPIYTISRLQNGNTSNYTYIYTALGIQQEEKGNTYNQGSLITKYHLQFYNNNPYMDYTIK